MTPPLATAPIRYLHTRIDGEFDPPSLAVRLARARLVDRYVVYEQGGRWWFAGGAVGSVAVETHGIRTSWPGEDRLTAWAGTHPIRALGAALRDTPVANWRAYGWIAFDT